jgi:hypothetical protein
MCWNLSLHKNVVIKISVTHPGHIPSCVPLCCFQEAHAARLAELEHREAGEEGAAAGPALRERLQEAEQARAALQQEVDRLTAQLHSGRHGPPYVQVRGRDTQTDVILLDTCAC